MLSMQRNRKAHAAMTTTPQPAPNSCRRCGGEARVSIFGNRVTCEDDDCNNEGPYRKRELEAILAWNEENPGGKEG